MIRLIIITFILSSIYTTSCTAFISPPTCKHHKDCNNVHHTFERSSSLSYVYGGSSGGIHAITKHKHNKSLQKLSASTITQPINELADDDLIALPFDGYISSLSTTNNNDNDNNDDIASTDNTNSHNPSLELRLCVVRNQAQNILPLVRHEDDVETDLFLDPRHVDKDVRIRDVLHYWSSSSSMKSSTLDSTITDNSAITEVPYFGIGWYGQRPVPSLGGGPGYGAEADEIWSINEDILTALIDEVSNVEVPLIDVGIAHGEKARGGALF